MNFKIIRTGNKTGEARVLKLPVTTRFVQILQQDKGLK